MRSLNRRVSWLMAEKSFDKPIISLLATLIGAVLVSRVIDNMRTMAGTVFLLYPKENPRVLREISTKFNGLLFEVRGSIYLPTINGEFHKLDIIKIQGPYKILLKIAPAYKDALD
jgi:glycerol-3-phosphate O-acyltransferase/dihydroxyacetone phosphate acyltransferase